MRTLQPCSVHWVASSPGPRATGDASARSDRLTIPASSARSTISQFSSPGPGLAAHHLRRLRCTSMIGHLACHADRGLKANKMRVWGRRPTQNSWRRRRSRFPVLCSKQARRSLVQVATGRLASAKTFSMRGKLVSAARSLAKKMFGEGEIAVQIAWRGQALMARRRGEVDSALVPDPAGFSGCNGHLGAGTRSECACHGRSDFAQDASDASNRMALSGWRADTRVCRSWSRTQLANVISATASARCYRGRMTKCIYRVNAPFAKKEACLSDKDRTILSEMHSAIPKLKPPCALNRYSAWPALNSASR
jgi:hypothetical protein